MARFSEISWVRLPLPEAEPGALFGAAVAVHGETVVVGAPSKDHGGVAGSVVDVGRAYVFQWDGLRWAPMAALSGPDSRGSLLGAAVATDGDRVAVGAPRARVRGTEHAGHVLIFDRADGRWIRGERLVDPHGPEPDDGFGAALALQGDLLVVGAPLEVSDAGPPGVVHTFRRREGGAWKALAPSWRRWRTGPDADPAPEDEPGSLFGRHLALDRGNLAVAQDRWGDGPAIAALFGLEASGWSRARVIRAPRGVVGAGAGLALHEDLLAVGVPTSPIGDADRAGVVCLYRRQPAGWVHEATLHAPVPSAGQRFGEAVAVHQDALVVGAPGQQEQGRASVGAAFIFERDEAGRWACSHEFSPPGDDDRGAWSRLGEAVAIHGRTAVVGAPGADGAHGGAAFVIEPA